MVTIDQLTEEYSVKLQSLKFREAGGLFAISSTSATIKVNWF